MAHRFIQTMARAGLTDECCGNCKFFSPERPDGLFDCDRLRQGLSENDLVISRCPGFMASFIVNAGLVCAWYERENLEIPYHG